MSLLEVGLLLLFLVASALFAGRFAGMNDLDGSESRND